MRTGNVPLVACVIALAAAPLLAQESSPPSTVPVETGVTSPETVPVTVTGTVNALADDLIELDVRHVLTGSSDLRSELSGKVIGFTLTAATEKPAGLRLDDRVNLSFKEVDGRRVVTRIVLAPPPLKVAAAPVAGSTANLGPATQSSAPAPAKPVSHQPGDSQAPAASASATKSAAQLNQAASLAGQTASSPAASGVGASAGAIAGPPGPEASPATRPSTSSSELDPALLTPPSSSEPEPSATIEVSAHGGNRDGLLAAIGLAALSALAILGFKLRRKDEAVVGLGLSPSAQRR
jgi:hypothetical protein